jgi:hypothetical protein
MQIYKFKSFVAIKPKQTLLFLYLLIISLSSKGQFSEDFSDGDFTSNPTWSGDAINYKINSSFQLQLNGTVAATSYLSTPSSVLNNVEWDFFVKISLAPTTGNNTRIYLVSDQANLKGNLNGYYIFLGTNKDVELVKQTGISTTVLFSGIPHHVSNSVNNISFKITRDSVGLWTVLTDTTGGMNYVPEGNSFTDNSFISTNYFGIYCQYTISDATKFYFDNFYVGSVLHDTIPPAITNLSVISATTLDVHFNEAVDPVSSENLSNYSVDYSLGNPSIAIRDGFNWNLVHLTFTNPFADGIIYNLTATDIYDLSNNILISGDALFGIPNVADSFDIVINEILYAPLAGGSDYVELYNRSNKIFDLKDLSLANMGFTSGMVIDTKPIIAASYLFLPGDYIVLTGSISEVKNQFYTSNPNGFIQLPSMPMFYVDSGGVAVIGANSKIIDQFQFSDAMQFPLLTDFHGVSLERLNFDRATQDNTNWHSASQGNGFGTPGYKNSQFESTQNTNNTFFCEPAIFSPDNDGHNDVVNFHYHFNLAGNVGTIIIFDAKGRVIRSLVANELLGTDGEFSWDGINDQNSKALIGIYIAYLSVFDLKGNTNTFKKTCILVAKL